MAKCNGLWGNKECEHRSYLTKDKLPVGTCKIGKRFGCHKAVRHYTKRGRHSLANMPWYQWMRSQNEKVDI